MSSTLGTIKDAATVIALLLGGCWGIYRFNLHRTLNSFVKLEIEGNVLVSEGDSTRVVLDATVRNPSATGVARRLAWIELQPLAPRDGSVQRITLVQPKVSDEVRRYGVFGSFKYLEPGEEFRDSLLLAVPPDADFLLIKLFFAGGRPGETWRIRKVLFLGASDSGRSS